MKDEFKWKKKIAKKKIAIRETTENAKYEKNNNLKL